MSDSLLDPTSTATTRDEARRRPCAAGHTSVTQQHASTPAARPHISVVIPTCRRPESLARCLDALLRQDLPGDAYEIVVADDAADPATRAAVERWRVRAAASRIAVVYVPVTGAHGPAAARNAGWRAATSAQIAFTDDDCLPRPGWLRAGSAALDAGLAGASGRIVVPLRERPTDYERNASHLASATFVTANCFYQRSVLQALGGFDTRFEMAWREDSDLHFRLLARGARLGMASDAVVEHPVRPAGWGVSLRQQRKSQYNALLFKRHPNYYRERVQAAPPWAYYLTTAALVTCGYGLARRCRRWTLSGGALWLMLTARFCAHRLRDTTHAPAHVGEMFVTSALIPPLAIYWRLRGALRYRVVFL